MIKTQTNTTVQETTRQRARRAAASDIEAHESGSTSGETVEITTTGAADPKTKSAEIVYVIDVNAINGEKQRMFKDALIERLTLLSEGNASAISDAMPVFCTTYKPNPFGPDVEQYWTAFMGEGYPESFSAFDMLVPDGDEPDVDVLSDAVAAFKNADISCLHFMPLMGPKLSPVVPVYAQARGTASDKTPFVIHTKPLGRIIARVIDDRFEFAPVDGQIITDHMQKILNRWFGEQLAGALTAEFLCAVFADAAASFLYRSINVSGLRKQLGIIEEVGRDLVTHL